MKKVLSIIICALILTSCVEPTNMQNAPEGTQYTITFYSETGEPVESIDCEDWSEWDAGIIYYIDGKRSFTTRPITVTEK